MNKKILLSVLTIGAVLAAVGGVTWAQFTNSETSTGNTFSAGTIDIAVDDQNPWSHTGGYKLEDMKPSYTDYIDFVINNVGTNPADVWKTLTTVVTDEGVQSEPECLAQGATWDDAKKACVDGTPVHDIDSVIGYDLSMRVYDGPSGTGNELQYQRLYNDDVTIKDVATKPMYLGMIPNGGSMKVHQSYHMKDTAGNEYQGDKMTFDIVLEAKQLLGGALGESRVLENKDYASGLGDIFDIREGDDIKGTLSYTVMSPTFDFSFTGKVTKPNTEYALLLTKDPWPQTGSIELKKATSLADGSITFSGSKELGANLTNQKVWLVLTGASDWNGTQMNGWHPADYLFETGLISYHDTDL